ncbi:polypeptide N-acetylgalactosaminyltransferase 5 [Fukomys damarensis]|uniref:Polypeptide N-acetylgalactosaminyltransferase n=1 Tax=Fukomys damarensis TaxID=885580 RepID=A0A091CV54_FUKDA|nr:polypeptide N-acetylgalactosaminyltransferase 5 [Fukomys damarensis]KFO22412.1 Polypeptide N-acetylgalactosaminyltransferase 5 [Fukomys damarensis]
MNKIRKFFRGSGRVLAFIFVASVVWLLFDMAALRLSFSEINTQVLKEDIVRREQRRFRVQADEVKMLSSSVKEMRLSPRGHRKRVWGKENFSRIEKGVLGTGDDLDQAQRERKMQNTPVRDKVLPLWHPTHLQTPVVTLTKQKTGVKDSKLKAFSLQMTPKQTTVQGAQKSPFVAPRRAALVKKSGHIGLVGIKQEALKTYNLSSATFKQVAEKDFSVTTRSDKEKQQSQAVATKRTHPASPPVPNSGEAIALNKTETQSKELHANKHNVRKGVPFVKFTADSNGLRKLSTNKTQLKGLLKDDGAKATLKKKLNFSESHVVIITKEEKLKIDTKEIPDSKIKTVFPEKLDKSHEKQISRIRSKASLPSPTLQKITVSQTRHKLDEGLRAARINLTAEAQPVGHKQSHTEVLLPEDHGMHQVLRIDVTHSPRDPKAPGQFGHPVIVPPGKEKEAKRRWKEGNFNVYLSDLIPVDRAIEDTRPAGCAQQLVHNELPTTSIIMCFVDEVWSTLLRSVHSVLNRSPPHLIKEILLVDDFSTKDYLKDNLDRYMSQFPKVRILRLKERHGLIRARLAGAQNVTGDVLTFLDSHVECNVGWLEPLLERVYLSRKKVACPVIEVINDKDMSYMTVDNFQRGVFVWPMNFGWRTIPPDVIAKNRIKETDIIRCPVMAGGLFSIDKNYFFELGTYDPGLDVWGGENMELSFKVWMCGGEIEIIPCSRVGHIFRSDNPYSFPKDRMKTVERNLVRVAEVWLDEYKELFYGHGAHLIDQGLDAGNLTQQKELREKLKCKSFRWYLENVFPDLKAPIVRASGVLINVALGKCISIENTTAILEDCEGSSKLQQFNYTWLRLIKHEEWCLAPIPDKVSLELYTCDNRNKGLRWLHKSTSVFHPDLVNHIVFENSPQLLCLEGNFSQKTLKLAACDSVKPHQKWKFENYYED